MNRISRRGLGLKYHEIIYGESVETKRGESKRQGRQHFSKSGQGGALRKCVSERVRRKPDECGDTELY